VSTELAALTAQLEQHQSAPRPLGVGALTLELLTREVGDWGPLPQPPPGGQLTRACVRVSVPRAKRAARVAITRHGNPRLRHLLIEAVWRLLKFQPNLPGHRQMARRFARPAPEPRRKKKDHRGGGPQLAVDLWRLATGRVQR